MCDETKLLYLRCFFSELTEVNQQYILGLVDGLVHAQGVSKGKQQVKTPDNYKSVKPAFYKCSIERKTCP